MSLPSAAIFYKNNREVGIGFCNIGWFVNESGIHRCCRDAMEDALDYFTPLEKIKQKIIERDGGYEYTGNIEKALNWIRERREINSIYFTTLDDLHSFDYLIVYGYKCYRKHIMDCLMNRTSNEDFVKTIEKIETK